MLPRQQATTFRFQGILGVILSSSPYEVVPHYMLISAPQINPKIGIEQPNNPSVDDGHVF